MALQGLTPEVELPATIGVVLHAKAISHQEFQVRGLRIVDAQLLARHDSLRGHEAQRILSQGGRSDTGNPVVVQEVGQRDEHSALAGALEGETSRLDDAEGPAEVLEIRTPASPDAGRDLVGSPPHTVEVPEPILHDVCEEGRVYQRQLPLGEPKHVCEGQRQQPDPRSQHGVRVDPLQREAQGEHRVGVALVPPGSLGQLRGHTLQRVDLLCGHAKHCGTRRQRPGCNGARAAA
mmetsp:Transcript_68795/g.174813  ORF Transcript_68795/g.174813 Transcript_68795/m.174813 type:complete len:235 (-) Transcript_68795:282-986(-)